MNDSEESIIVTCPDCGYEIDLGPDPEIGETITCPECWAYLVITNLDPLELSWEDVNTEDEDWEDEEDS